MIYIKDIIWISKSHHVEAHFYKILFFAKMRKYDIKYDIWHLMFEAVNLILQVLIISICDISYIEWLRNTFHVLSDHIYCKYFFKKINVPCMEIMETCCYEGNLNLLSLSNCNFLHEICFGNCIKKMILKQRKTK